MANKELVLSNVLINEICTAISDATGKDESNNFEFNELPKEMYRSDPLTKRCRHGIEYTAQVHLHYNKKVLHDGCMECKKDFFGSKKIKAGQEAINQAVNQFPHLKGVLLREVLFEQNNKGKNKEIWIVSWPNDRNYQHRTTHYDLVKSGKKPRPHYDQERFTSPIKIRKEWEERNPIWFPTIIFLERDGTPGGIQSLHKGLNDEYFLHVSCKIHPDEKYTLNPERLSDGSFAGCTKCVSKTLKETPKEMFSPTVGEIRTKHNMPQDSFQFYIVEGDSDKTTIYGPLLDSDKISSKQRIRIIDTETNDVIRENQRLDAFNDGRKEGPIGSHDNDTFYLRIVKDFKFKGLKLIKIGVTSFRLPTEYREKSVLKGGIAEYLGLSTIEFDTLLYVYLGKDGSGKGLANSGHEKVITNKKDPLDLKLTSLRELPELKKEDVPPGQVDGYTEFFLATAEQISEIALLTIDRLQINSRLADFDHPQIEKAFIKSEIFTSEHLDMVKKNKLVADMGLLI